MGPLNFILDTNAVIYLQKGLLDEVLPHGNTAISVITEIELRGFSGLLPDQETWLVRFLSSIQIIGLDHASRKRPSGYVAPIDSSCRMLLAMIIVSATAWWAMPTLQIQAVDFLAFVGWALPTIPYRLAARGPNDDQVPDSQPFKGDPQLIDLGYNLF